MSPNWAMGLAEAAGQLLTVDLLTGRGTGAEQLLGQQQGRLLRQSDFAPHGSAGPGGVVPVHLEEPIKGELPQPQAKRHRRP